VGTKHGVKRPIGVPPFERCCSLAGCGKSIPYYLDQGLPLWRRQRYCSISCANRSRAKPINHGTYSGYVTHHRRGLPIEGCGCNEARDVYIADWKARRPGPAKVNELRKTAMHRARAEVLANHQAEYRRRLNKIHQRLLAEAELSRTGEAVTTALEQLADTG
jgi:hypothetical protein